MKINKGFRFWLSAAALVMVTACGGGGGPDGAGGVPPPAPPANPPANPPMPADPQVRQTIGAAGGEIAFADQRFKLTIPPGALGNATEIVVTELSPANVPANLQPLNADKVYRLEPSGTQFAAPVTVTAQLPASDAIALMTHESNGTFETPPAQKVALAGSGRTLSAQISHFSHVAMKTDEDFTVRIQASPKTLQVGATVGATVAVNKAASASSTGTLALSKFAWENVAVEFDLPPRTGVDFGLNEAKALGGQVYGRCLREGPGHFAYSMQIENYTVEMLIVFKTTALDISVSDDFVCTERPGTGNVIPTGVRRIPGITLPDVTHVIRSAFGPFSPRPAGAVRPLASNGIDATSGALAVVAGAEGTVIVDLVSGQAMLDWTRGSPERDVLGSPLIGVLPVSRPGPNAPAALFGYSTTGGSTVRTALRNYDPAGGGFGFTAIGFSPTFDASTVGGDVIADGFISVGPRGIDLYEYGTNGYQGASGSGISSFLFPGGQLVSAFRVASDSAVLALTRGHDGNTTSRLWAHAGTGTQMATPLATLPGEVRRLRCIGMPSARALCGATAASGSTSLFMFDPASAFAPVSPLTVPTGNGSLGISLGVRANGNPYAVVANFDADTLNVIETTPDLTLVGNQVVAAAAGCLQPAHVGLLTDSEGDKAVVTCNGSASLWVERLFQ